MKGFVCAFLLVLYLIVMPTLTSSIAVVKADYVWTETITINANGTVTPTDAPISRAGDVYTLTDNIINAAPSNESIAIVVDRNNTVLDGAGYTLQGIKAYGSIDIKLENVNNAAIKNMNIKQFGYGVYLYFSSNSSISQNNISNILFGVRLDDSSDSTISQNNITNSMCGVQFYNWYYDSSRNVINGNNIKYNTFGFYFSHLSNSTISGNNITNNHCGIIIHDSSYNRLYHNNFIKNNRQVMLVEYDEHPSVNIWDNGYPSGGNYWSDYMGIDDDGDGIGDTPYPIDYGYGFDMYPLVHQYTIPESPPSTLFFAFVMSTTALLIFAKKKNSKTKT